MTALPQQDVAWKLEELTPERPKSDGSAEVFLNKIGMTPEQYKCDVLVVVKTDIHDECSICKQKETTTKLCRINRKGIFCDIPVCPDCINVFIEYNPCSVFDLKSKAK